MSALDFADLLRHQGHAVEVVTYGPKQDEPWNVAAECCTCGEVLLDFDAEDEPEPRSACSVCTTEHMTRSLDATGRCQECQP